MKLRDGWLSLVIAILMLTGTAWADDAVDINTATVKQLQSVDGIGETIAARIVAYRNAHGVFGSVHDLMRVKGIGEKRLAKAEDALAVGKENGKEKKAEHEKHDD